MFRSAGALSQIGILLMVVSLSLVASAGMVHGSTRQSLSEFQITNDATPVEHEPSDPEHSIRDAGIRMIVSLLLVLALIVAAVVFLKKITPYKGFMSRVNHPMLVLSKIPLGQKRFICLVRVADEILVIGLTNTNVSLLSKMNADDYFNKGGEETHDASEAGYERSFRRLLDKIGVSGHRTSDIPKKP